MSSRYCVIIFSFLTINLFCTGCAEDKQNEILPGQYEGYTLLPNGWRLTPAGTHVDIGELPLNMVLSPDGKYAITSNSGAGEHSLSVVQISNMEEIQRMMVDRTWRGLSFNNSGDKLYVSGGNNNLVSIYNFRNGQLKLDKQIHIKDANFDGELSISGVAFIPGKNLILAVSKNSNSLYIIDEKNNSLKKTIKLKEACFDVIVNHKGTLAYVSLWGGAKIVEIDLSNLETSREFKVGDHPCEMLLSKDDARLFVTNANHNSTSVLDIESGKETELIISALKADAPYGSTPNSICFNENESVLFIANADNNYLALFDISEPGESRSLGFIPVGWYPTSVKFCKQNSQILVANGKGLTSKANPFGPKPGQEEDDGIDQYIGRFFKGSLSRIELPGSAELTKYSEKVYLNTPYYEKKETWKGRQQIIAEQHDGKPSKHIRHVFYIIKENRTYDQVFGDIARGNGDPSLCLFPEKVTPNMHKLAQEYTLFDNFYVEAEVSADGHNWSTAAYASDYVEKTWPTLYGGRGGNYVYEGGSKIASPSSGYIWDEVIKKGMIYRNYGEFVKRVSKENRRYQAVDDYLKPHTCELFPGYDLSIPDVYRYEQWEEDFRQFEKSGHYPNLSVMRLPNDHTAGTSEGYPTVQAMAADNDYALGLVVDRISKSKIWKNSMIFVLEDDAQNGSDHVDAHRSPMLMIGPYVKRGFHDKTQYSTSSVLKTIELILGLQPMTQFDLSATPLLNAVSDEPDFASYDVIKPKIDLNEMNDPAAYGSKRCSELNLAVEDAIPDVEFNEIIWKAVKGADSDMPAPVRSAFVQVLPEDDE